MPILYHLFDDSYYVLYHTDTVKKNPKPLTLTWRQNPSNKDTVGPLKDENKDLVTDKGQIAAMLNKFFSLVFTKHWKHSWT